MALEKEPKSTVKSDCATGNAEKSERVGEQRVYT
jgi:hypothetical protein